MEDASKLCPVCYQQLTAAGARCGYTTNCGHIFCMQCLAEHVWRQQARPRPACAVCRQLLTECAPLGAGAAAAPLQQPSAAAPSALLRVQLGRVVFCAPLDAMAADPLGWLAGLFKVPARRLKAVHRGKLVATPGELARAAASGHTVLLLLGSREKPAPAWWRALCLAWARCRAAALDALRALLHSVDQSAVLRRTWEVARAFLSSASPEYRTGSGPGPGPPPPVAAGRAHAD